MKSTIKLGDRDYVPLAAVPYLTGEFFSPNDLAHMLVDPESYCSDEDSPVLSALKITPSGNPVSTPREAFKAWADPSSPAMPLSEAAAIVVPVDTLRRLFNLIVRGMGRDGKLSTVPVWDGNAALDPAVAQAIQDRCHAPLQRIDTRANSKAAKLARMEEVVATVERCALQAGIPFDRQQIPGRKKDLLEILVKVDPSLAMSSATFDSHYAPNLGLRWRQGSKPKDAEPLLHVFGLKLRS